MGSCNVIPLTVCQGDTDTYVITVFDACSGDPVDITGALIELEVKPKVGDPDSELCLYLFSPGSGITILPQLDDTLGQAEILLDPVSTAACPVGQFEYDIFVTIPAGGGRHIVVLPSPFTVRAVVNNVV